MEALSTTYVGPDYSQVRICHLIICYNTFIDSESFEVVDKLPQSSEYADVSLKDIDQVAKSSFPFHFV